MSGMPNITIRFVEKAATAIKRGSRGVVGLILRGTVPSTNPVIVTTENDIGSNWTNANKMYVSDALKGYVEKPKKVVVFFISTSAEDYSDALTYFSKNYVDYLAIPTVTTDELETSVKSWVQNEWSDHHYIMAVLPDFTADFEGVVNVTSDGIVIGSTDYTTEQITPRIAGLLAGTPMEMSATYAPLPDVDDVERLTKEQMDAAVNAGKFILFHDGEKVKVGRAVTSFTTTTPNKGESFKKIKLVDTMRTISTDIRTTIEDSYIGKVPNIYDNKVNLCNAIKAYFAELARQQVVEDDYTIDVDTEANAIYLTSKGIDVSEMSDDEIKKANTGDHVYLIAKLHLVDVMEDLDLPIYI